MAAPGDTTWVQAHHDTWLDWYNDFDAPVRFPSGSVSYGKIEMIFILGKYVCPGNPQYCADWDYTVQAYIMAPSWDTLGLGKLITPYAKGPRMPSGWKGEYIFDVTDYYPVLKDSATVRIHYSGYSGGFTANVRFAFIEGPRTRDVLRIDRLWHGSFDYGNASAPIEDEIAAAGRTVPAGTEFTELKFNITGHGGDDGNCAEFCRKNYRVLLNSATADQRSIWRDDCGSNPLYPQSGTWIYNRGNWCPGDLVKPNVHRLTGLKAGDHYTVDVDFDPHTSTTAISGRSPAQYIIEAAVFYYGKLNKGSDVSLEDILSPTDADRHFRTNAMCGDPVVRVKNTGSSAVSAIRFQYGVGNTLADYEWKGSLDALGETEITLPQIRELATVSGSNIPQRFTVRIREVNGAADEDLVNNEMTSWFTPAPRWPLGFVVSLKTNKSVTAGVSHSSWAIYDQAGAIVRERKNLSAGTTYTDTVGLAPGCYRLEVKDAGCDGLSWWANSGAGNGSFSVRPVNSMVPYSLNGYFSGDFGCGFTQYFSADWPVRIEPVTPDDGKADLLLYPNPAQGSVNMEIRGVEQVSGTIRVMDALGRVVARQACNGYAEVISTSSYADGVYTVEFVNDRPDHFRLRGRFIVNNAF